MKGRQAATSIGPCETVWTIMAATQHCSCRAPDSWYKAIIFYKIVFQILYARSYITRGSTLHVLEVCAVMIHELAKQRASCEICPDMTVELM